MPQVNVRILEEDIPQAGDVDHKLVELARRIGAKIVTNDFNLKKVATVQGFSVLNVNQLAHALKPAVLPGEPTRVLILREDKEPNQGVAYLDDGTMVVVDGARRMINKSVDRPSLSSPPELPSHPSARKEWESARRQRRAVPTAGLSESRLVRAERYRLRWPLRYAPRIW